MGRGVNHSRKEACFLPPIEVGQRYEHRYSGKVVEILEVCRTEPRQRNTCIVQGHRDSGGVARVWHIQWDTLERHYTLKRTVRRERSLADGRRS